MKKNEIILAIVTLLAASLMMKVMKDNQKPPSQANSPVAPCSDDWEKTTAEDLATIKRQIQWHKNRDLNR
jgi:hypothetical protein